MLEIEKINKSSVHDQFVNDNNLKLLSTSDINGETINTISHYSLQFYGEHCTECAAPDCHSSCDLYSRGPTVRCRRFLGGILAKKNKESRFNYTFDIIFKPWGRLLTIGNTRLHQADNFFGIQSFLVWTGYLWQKSKLFFSFLNDKKLWFISDKLTGLGNKVPQKLNPKNKETPSATHLLFLVGNPSSEVIEGEIIVSQLPPTGMNFRRSVTLKAGWNEIYFPIEDVTLTVDLMRPFRMTYVPLVEKETYLQVAYYGFIKKEKNDISNNKTDEKIVKPIKLLIIDLDNTLWDGVLIENVEQPRKLKKGVEEVLRTLDSRGILLSISSKNNLNDAQKSLESLGIWELFLHPQINWEPKSGNISLIVNNINIGMDTVAFIDDSIFEREQVAQSHKDIRVYSDDKFRDLLSLEEFNPIVTSDSQNRRKYYQDENARKEDVSNNKLNYDDFLKSCKMIVTLSNVVEDNKERVYELIQRTNQLNFSGKKYSAEEVKNLLMQESSIPLVVSCEDKYGKYGVVGFALLTIENKQIIIQDMMLSCRILGKKVEQAILFYTLELRKQHIIDDIKCVFNETSRNLPAKNVLIDFGVEFKSNTNHLCLINSNTESKTINDLPLTLVDNTTTLNALK